MQINQTVDRCPSTNDLAKCLAEQGAPHGSWVSSRIQEVGRGRLGRNWNSIEGNLFLSIICRKVEQHLWSWIPLTTSLGVVRYLHQRYPSLTPQIKWPNDIYLWDRKLGGILCESVGGPHPFVVIGLGLNCFASPQGPGLNAIDLTSALKHQPIVTANDVRLALIHSILSEFDQLILKGPQSIAKDYLSWAYLKEGTEIQWNSGAFSGIIQGLGPLGELIVRTSQGETLNLYAEEVSLRSSNKS